MAFSLIGLATGASGCLAESVRAVSDGEAARALEAARSRIGDPYVWAGQAPGGFDCSGLILWAYQQALGLLRLRRPDGWIVSDATMHEIYSWHCAKLSSVEAGPGDIVAIVQDGNEVITHGGLVERADSNEVWFINASSYHGRVVSDAWPLVGNKRGQHVVGFGRLLVVERMLLGFIRL